MLIQRFIDGLWTRNVATTQLLGLCPLLAVSYNIKNALGLAAASTFVLLSSSCLVSLLRRGIPENIRLPCFVLVIATFTSIAHTVMQAYAWDIYQQIALFVQIIVTNCMILGHVESVASRESVTTSVVTAAGTALGFSLVLLALGGVRQVLGILTPFATQPVGSFFVIGIALAVVNFIRGHAPTDDEEQTQTEPHKTHQEYQGVTQ